MEKIALTIPGFGNIEPAILPTGIQTGGLPGTGEIIISVLIQSLIISALGFALYVMAHAGFNMITSGGDKERFAQGRERLRYAIIGLIVIFSSFFIINFFGQLFGIKLINPSSPPASPQSSCDGISCTYGCYTWDWIRDNLPPSKCGHRCATQGEADGLYEKACPGIPTSAPILTSVPTPPAGSNLSPTPTPKFVLAGQSIIDPELARVNLPWPITNNLAPQKGKIDCVFKGGDSSNIKTVIRLSNNPGKEVQIGEVISFPLNTTNVDIAMTVRPGASPTCFDNITCYLISTEPGSKGLPIDKRDLANNVCIKDTLSAFFANHSLDEVLKGQLKNKVTSRLNLVNFSPVEQTVTFSFDSNNCFPVAQQTFQDFKGPTSPSTPRTIPPNGVYEIIMNSILAFGTTLDFTQPINCPVSIHRILE